MRITLNVILRAIFGADGAELQRLRDLIPKWVTLGSRLARAAVTRSVTGPLDAVGQARPTTGAPTSPGRHPDQPGPPGPAPRGPHRRAVAVPAQHLRRRLGHDPPRDRRRVADPAGRRPRDHGVHPGAGRSSGSPAIPRCCAAAGGRGRHRGQHLPAGHDLRGPAQPHGHRLRRPHTSQVPIYELGEWRVPQGYLDHGEPVRSCTRTPTSSPIRNGSTRSASSTTSPTRSPGFRSAAAPGAVSARPSPTWRWTSCCEPCCGTSPFRPRRAGGEVAFPRRRLHAEEGRPRGDVPPPSRRADVKVPATRRREESFASARAARSATPVRAWAASSPAAGSGRCSRWGSAPGSPGARARPPRTGRPASTSVTTLPGHRPEASTSAMVSSATRCCSSSR